MQQSPSQLIDAKGGPSAFAAKIGASPESARAMKHRNRIPRSVWPEVMMAFEDITLDVLMAAEAVSENAEVA